MIIGILSMQNVINFGSYLQTYALKRIIESLGNEVYYIAITPGRQIVVKRQNGAARPFIIDKYILKRIDHVIFQKRRENDFYHKYFPAILIDKPVKDNNCNMIVIGSDEVFNCLTPSSWGFSTQLFGDTYVPAITYAASCGATTYEKVKEVGIIDELRKSMKKLNAISVRDENTFNFVYMLTGKYPYQHLDPVLVYDWTKEAKQQSRYSNYILIYAYDNRINDINEIEGIKEFARKKGKKIISFGFYQRWCDKNVLCSPFELLSYFDGADYVITDTFHGTVISIKRNKQFATIVRNSNQNKLSDLLCRFSLVDREVKDIKSLEAVLEIKIDYDYVNSVIKKEAIRTRKFLKENIK